MRRRVLWVGLVLALLVLLCALVYIRHRSLPRGVVYIHDQPITVEIADTDASRVQGLSGRQSLLPNHGMLFVFGHDGFFSFWMKDMHFPIDMVWVSAVGNIVYMQENISPNTYPQSFVSTTSARYVLELPAHYVSEHHVKVGDNAVLP